MRLRALICAATLPIVISLPASAAEPASPTDTAQVQSAAPTLEPASDSPSANAAPSTPAQPPASTASAEATPAATGRFAHYRQQMSKLLGQGMEHLGTPYRRGGTSESGFDCSGLVYRVFSDAIGLNLPRSSREMARVGEKVAPGDLKPGDLVFFKTVRRTISHVGIYVGNHQFLHSPASGGEVRVDDMHESYWATRFAAARRMLDAVDAPASQSKAP